jgi:type IV secretion system protein VirD4
MRKFFDNLNFFANMARSFDEDAHRADQRDFERRARLRALQTWEEQLEKTASGALGDARLGTLKDAFHASMLDTSGLYIGALDGKMLYLNSDGHHLTYGRAGSGKGTTSVQPNLAHYTGSMFVIDVKDGELHYSSAEHRQNNLGHKIITLDPWGIRSPAGARANPLARLGGIVAGGGRIDNEADEITHILLPKGKADAGESAWARSGARRLLVLAMKHFAYSDRSRLSLEGLWRFINCPDDQLIATFDAMIAGPQEDVAGSAAVMKAVLVEAPKQFEAYRADCIDVLSPYSPGSSLAKATALDEVDFGRMKHEKITVYLTVPSAKLSVAAPWLAMILNHAIEQIAAEVGPDPVRFLVDEFAQLPAPIPAVMKAMRLYRGRGILLSLYCQGRFSLQDAGYSEGAVKEIEDQAACIQMWGVEEPSLLKDVETWSGTSSIVQIEPSHSGGAVAHDSFRRSEQKRPVLQSEDIRRVGDGQQIIKMPGFPLFVANRIPYYRITPWKDQLFDVRDLHFGERKKDPS